MHVTWRTQIYVIYIFHVDFFSPFLAFEKKKLFPLNVPFILDSFPFFMFFKESNDIFVKAEKHVFNQENRKKHCFSLFCTTVLTPKVPFHAIWTPTVVFLFLPKSSSRRIYCFEMLKYWIFSLLIKQHTWFC